MLTLKVGEKEEFQYSAEDLAIQAADKNTGWEYTWRIEFYSLHQLSQFREMLEFIEEQKNKGGTNVKD